MAKKHMADGRPELVIGVSPEDESEDDPDAGGEHEDDGGRDADGLEVSQSLIDAIHSKNPAGVWESLKAAHDVAKGRKEPEPEEDEPEAGGEAGDEED